MFKFDLSKRSESRNKPALETKDQVVKRGNLDISTPEGRADMLDHLRKVGPLKPLGYLPLQTLSKCEVTPEQMAEDLSQRGIKTIILNSDGREHSFFFAYDENALGLFLESRRSILEKAHWPTDPASFVAQVDGFLAEGPSDLFDLIADAFADYNNPGRQDMKGSV